MTAHSFVDESKEPSYLMAAALLRPIHLTAARQCISGLVRPGQRRIHFNNERDRRRSEIMSRLVELPIEVVLFVSKPGITQKHSRQQCLSALVKDHVTRCVRRLVLERDDSLVEFDRRQLKHELHLANAYESLTYEHLRAHEEPLLSIPGALAWCWARGGHWRVKAKRLWWPSMPYKARNPARPPSGRLPGSLPAATAAGPLTLTLPRRGMQST